jgi:hypothetical protein
VKQYSNASYTAEKAFDWDEDKQIHRNTWAYFVTKKDCCRIRRSKRTTVTTEGLLNRGHGVGVF